MKKSIEFKENQWGYTATEGDIKKIEQDLNCILPHDYVDFMSQYNDFIPSYEKAEFGYCYNVKWSDGQDKRLKKFYSIETVDQWIIIHPSPPTINSGGISTTISNLNEAINNYLEHSLERIPVETIPIAHTGGGNLLLLGIKGENHGKVYYWVMNLEREPGEPTYDNIGFVANNFTDFLNSLYPCEE